MKLTEYKNAQRMDGFVRGGRRMERKKLPVGIDSFEKLRREAFYYVDKTGLIIDLLNNWGEVGRSQPFHPSAAFRQDAEHEHAEVLF